ncbi:ATP-binding protein [Microbulbifer pacificus]|uniref:ATP-binding protein n=1 Tax=Microbulbifer pacificus TaxID=407164 RepID=UPI00131A4828|nr:ATP-binding protein [Microbulbifer pacificus]
MRLTFIYGLLGFIPFFSIHIPSLDAGLESSRLNLREQSSPSFLSHFSHPISDINTQVSHKLYCNHEEALAYLDVSEINGKKSQSISVEDASEDLLFSDSQKEWLQKMPEIHVAFIKEVAPFSYVSDSGRYTGISDDVLTIISAKTGIRFKYKVVDNDGAAFSALRAGEVDLISGSVELGMKGGDLIYSVPYYHGYAVLVSRGDGWQRNVHGVGKYKNISIAVGKTLGSVVSAEYPEADLVYPKSAMRGIRMLLDGSVESVALLQSTADYYIRQFPYYDLRVVRVLSEDRFPVSFVGMKGDEELFSILNAVITKISPQDMYSMALRWREPSDLKSFFHANWYWILPVLVSSLLVVFSSLAWAIYLRRQIILRRKAEEVLQQQKSIAQQANRAKSQFVSVISHEIRTRMNSVYGILELLVKGPKDTVDNDELLPIALDSASDMLEMIGDVLDLSRVEEGCLILDFQRVNISELVHSVHRSFMPIASKKGLSFPVSFNCKLDKLLMADPVRVKQVVANLLSNALKNTAEGDVSTSVEFSKCSDNIYEVVISVRDTGCGISQHNMKSVFERFSAFPSSNDGRTSAGLGLFLCREICRLMDGELELTSVLSSGTKARAVFNLKLADDTTKIPKPHCVKLVRHQGPSFKVLIVDDHPTNLLLLRRQLESFGLEVSEEANGVLALRAFLKGRYDLVVTDCGMPIGDGYFLAREIRNFESILGIRRRPIVGYTANALSDEVSVCRTAGMDKVLFKPIKSEALNDLFLDLDVSNSYPEYQLFDVKNSLIAQGFDSEAIVAEVRTNNWEDVYRLLESYAMEIELEELAKMAHKLKGPAQLIHVSPMFSLCDQLENACLEGLGRDHVTTLIRRLVVVMMAIDRELSANSF